MRQYQGMWFRGKQHGLGVYSVPGTEPKCGLWEDGKRIEWFDQPTAQAILSGQIDFTQYF
jgi:MORN repeat